MVADRGPADGDDQVRLGVGQASGDGLHRIPDEGQAADIGSRTAGDQGDTGTRRIVDLMGGDRRAGFDHFVAACEDGHAGAAGAGHLRATCRGGQSHPPRIQPLARLYQSGSARIVRSARPDP